MLHQNTVLIESCRDNNGERTVLRSSMQPYATELPHVHTLFKESFYVEAGTLDLWNGFGKVHLELAQAMSIEPLTPHHYVASKTGAIVTITLEPGNPDVEHALRIMQGLERDGTYAQLTAAEGTRLIFSMVMAQLTDADPVEDAKEQMEALLASEESYRVETLKRELLERYCS